MSEAIELIEPKWPAPERVKALATTRAGGVSDGDYSALNLATHVDDHPANVQTNRDRLMTAAGLPAAPCWLNQVHGNTVVDAANTVGEPDADASVTDVPGVVCAVMTADCLPVLLCASDGSRVGAVHAGWRGLETGVLQAALQPFAGQDVLAWLGPAIGPLSYEIDDRVRDHFLRLSAADSDFEDAFEFSRPGHWYFNLYRTAKIILAAAGVAEIYGGDFCTLSDERFYSYRRDGITGRQASLIWLENR